MLCAIWQQDNNILSVLRKLVKMSFQYTCSSVFIVTERAAALATWRTYSKETRHLTSSLTVPCPSEAVFLLLLTHLPDLHSTLDHQSFHLLPGGAGF